MYILRNGLLISSGKSCRSDILVSNGKIAQIAENIDCDATSIDLGGRVVSYGLADVHVHFREPGFSEKETIASGSRAAARGGYTTVCPMPNLNPAPDSLETLALEQELIRSQAVVEVLPFATITLGRRGRSLVDMKALRGSVAGFSDDGSGVPSGPLIREAMLECRECDGIISAHCEDMTQPPFSRESEFEQVRRDCALALETGCRYHVCHVSTAQSVDAVRKAKAAGARVSCETAPHYLTLCQDDIQQDDGRFRMNPPLRTAADRKALIEALQDGTIEVIATDHAPHTAEQKSRGYRGSAMGIVGLETAFPVLYTRLVLTGIITLEKLFELLCDNPRRIFSLGGGLKVGQRADLAIFDLDTEYTIDSSTFASKGRSTPFEGWKVRGRCVGTIFGGKMVD